ncbi:MULTISPECIES: hypothetical protein [Moorena]|uniref:Uncharacterized protein n=1 Tax=Moorena producens PAL-8-15-08-1 TaxID=1458985 RepID=A0A1D8TRX6_9CYAN|nr:MULTISPECIES: hypothetical protein [Moorena]AOX00431.1 hypothetical protein BJP34_14055 [Moorena producens PAL-8-15-08-1]NEO70029.1 hypothetical protein [Moorena sp. SIO3H5]
MTPSPSEIENTIPNWAFETLKVSTIKSLIRIPVLILISILWSPLVFMLWNWLMPTMFDIQKVSWLQAIGLTILARLLFTYEYPVKSNG